MAHAEKTDVEEMQPVTVTRIVLTLTAEEARTLKDLLYNAVAGSPSGSRRGIADGISHALSVAGVKPREVDDISGHAEFLTKSQIKNTKK